MKTLEAEVILKQYIDNPVSIYRDDINGGIALNMFGKLQYEPEMDNCWSVVYDQGYQGVANVDFAPQHIDYLVNGSLLIIYLK